MVELSTTVKLVLVGLLCLAFGALAGAGGFYLYSTKVLLPKYKSEVVGEMFSSQKADWGDFFKKAEEQKSEEEYTNPFEGAEETGGGEYVNPFEVIE